ncbi:mechanosensitive ion channel family protein [Salinimicrobium sp. TH3]|uniref:mechanosensitive ion channel family protein n=1 Tax=Salinimicrobium sp. TH3 TaxID=2997342 RepID=UPI0022767818|nr:mechanosensitive ion channel family protein [Salinimicrobium sp. TH3]MCY2686921.1 mechanosensitive ion channel family protein [Salinimicrobium sp. TH3]
MAKKFDIQDSVEGIWEKLGEWLDSIILGLPNFILAVLVFIIFVFAAKYLGKLLDRLLRFKVRQASIREITIKIMKVVVIAIGFFVALGLLNLNTILTSVLAGAGVVGLAVGLALQGTLNNTFSGILLSFLPELQIGDWIENNGYAGRVVEINLRSIVIREADNNYVVIPNSQVIDAPFKNFSRTSRSRIMVNCGVAYNSDLELVKTITINTLSELYPQKKGEEVEFMYNEFGDSSINFVVRFWSNVTSNRDILLARSAAIIAIKKVYDQHDINIPFPIRTLEFNNRLNIQKPSSEGES